MVGPQRSVSMTTAVCVVWAVAVTVAYGVFSVDYYREKFSVFGGYLLRLLG